MCVCGSGLKTELCETTRHSCDGDKPTRLTSPERNVIVHFSYPRRPTFAKLVTVLYGATGMRQADGGRGPEFNPCEWTAMALYRLGHGAGVRATAALFGVSDGWVCNQTKDFVKRVCETLTPRYLVWPTRNEQDCIADAFEKRTGFR